VLIFSEEVSGGDVIKKWTNKINEILEPRGQLDALRPRIAEFARTHWDWQVCAGNYYRVFQKLI